MALPKADSSGEDNAGHETIIVHHFRSGEFRALLGCRDAFPARPARDISVQRGGSMAMTRLLALMMISVSTAAQAQQQAVAPPAPASTAATQANSQKVTCRIHMEANIQRRICMTNADWAKVDAQTQNGLNLSPNGDASYINRHGCGPDKGSVLGAC